MAPPHIAYSTALMVAGLICLVAGVLVLQTRRTAAGAIPLAILIFALSWWDLTYSLFWAGAPAPYPNFWLYVTYVGAVVVPAALLLFSMQLSGMGHWLKTPFITVLCVEPPLVLFLLFSDPWHGLFFGAKETQSIGMILAGGPVFWANVVYSYLLIVAGFVVLVRRYIQTSGIYKQQIGVVLIGAGIPWLNNFAFLFGYTPFPNADSTPLSFTAAGLAFTYALLRYRLLDIIPIARHVLIESMGDGLLVLDTRNRLVDINPTAKQILGASGRPLIGEPVENVFSAWPDVVKTYYEVSDIRAEVPIGSPPQSYFDLRITPLHDSHHNFIGRLVVWRDITPLKQAQTELQEQAIRDPLLTGLYNRRYLKEALERELARAEREEYSISLVMMDIDHFKDVNDTFGHSMGDSVLQRFAAQLLNQTRVGDIVCRYGGEEFLIVLPDVTTEIAYPIAQRWRSSFQENQLLHEGVEINATISCGIAEFPKHASSMEGLISAADKAMYQAKAAGRNRVAIWQNVTGI